MRWFFFFLLVLNVFYFVWHQQQVPPRAKEVAPLAFYRGGDKNIRLLSESSGLPRLPQLEGAQDSVSCIYFGPFPDEARAGALEQRLLSLDVEVARQTVEGVAGSDYWVYMPPLASRQASMWQLRELQARKIDSYLIAEGDLVNGISLGIFQDHQTADAVVGRMREAGYEAQVRELSRGQYEYWLQVAPRSGRLIDDALMRSLSSGFPDLHRQIMPCKALQG